jgi:type II secretory ATPase GspE/PulE/Tfp pilus assembly ATPase PilB-like protein
MSKNFLASTPQDLQRALLDEERHMQEEETASKAKSLHLPYINLHNFPLDLNVLSFFTEEEAKESQSVPFYKDGKSLRVGTLQPNNPILQQKLSELTAVGRYVPTVYLISKFSFEQTLKYFSKVLRPTSAFQDTVQIEDSIDYAQALKDMATVDPSKLSPIQYLTTFFGAALQYNASDIHIEPEEGFVKVRFRIDGVLQDMLHVQKPSQRALMARIKSLSKLKLNVENLPQDGRLSVYKAGKPIDVRVSTLPSSYGEGTVLRLLGTGAADLKIKDLGLQGKALAVVENGIAQPNGMIVTTGPTGSGKTTTLYAFLNELNEPGVKIITLEDPIEYKLPGVQQTPIDHNVDFSFAKGLKAILRQDPDIVMVGEIRDTETAETALQAALTGHIVLSTLHTNDASGAIPRLITMGTKPFVIAPALTVVIAQRLVRKLCMACKKPVTISKELLTKIQEILDAIPKNAEVEVPKKFDFFHATGCEACGGLGYKGRIGVFEVINVNEQIKELILASASAGQVKNQAVSDGMITMAQDGLLKALAGITDVEEVFRVAGS